MNLPVVFKKPNKEAAFTLIEVTLVTALIFILSSFVSPIGISFYHSQVAKETADGLVSALRQAQSFSVSGKYDSSFGVYIGSQEYVLFRGSSYASREAVEDVSFPISNTVEVSGPSEITFSVFNGVPSATGTINISMNTKEESIEVYSSGYVDR